MAKDKDIEIEPVPNAQRVRIEISALKARGYFEELGRGLLITEPDEDSPFFAWLRTHIASDGRCYRNRYITVADLKASGCPGNVVQMVEAYDPNTEAVVLVRFEADDYSGEPQVVSLNHGLLGSSPSFVEITPINDDDLPF